MARERTRLSAIWALSFITSPSWPVIVSAASRLPTSDGVNRTWMVQVAPGWTSTPTQALPVIKGRASLIRLLLQNFIANAVKYSSKSPRPRIAIGTGPGTGDGERRVGGAALEYRLIHHAWPRAGDRVELLGRGDLEVDSHGDLS